VNQLAVSGLDPPSFMSHEGVRLRPLSGLEQGAVVQPSLPQITDSPLDYREFALPNRFQTGVFRPSALLELRLRRQRSEDPSVPLLFDRVALALAMEGFEIGTSGSIAAYDIPRWYSFGALGHGFVTGERPIVIDRSIARSEFKRIVDLALQIPEFSPERRHTVDVVLDRLLRGVAAESPQGGFLDYVIALEGPLLPGDRQELAYKFALYGALFLRRDLDPVQTFERLRVIYRVRSDLVHGTAPRAALFTQAVLDAGALARLVATMMADADANLVGWTEWQWRQYNDPYGGTDEGIIEPDGKMDPGKIDALSETYAEAIAGTPTHMAFNPATGAFSLTYRAISAVHAPTVIFVPVALHYPHGYCTTARGARVTSPAGATHLTLTYLAKATDMVVEVRAGRC